MNESELQCEKLNTWAGHWCDFHEIGNNVKQRIAGVYVYLEQCVEWYESGLLVQ